MGKRPILHIGTMKSASTTLQRGFFAQHPKLHYFGEDGDGCLDKEADIKVMDSMVYEDDLYYNDENVEALFYEHAELAHEKGARLIYSNVDIVRSPVPSQLVERLYNRMPDAKILIVLRNQIDAVHAYYANHGVYLKPADPYHYRKFVDYNDWMNYNVIFGMRSPLNGFVYGEILSLYEDLFGKENIKIMFFEDFISKRPVFVQEVCDYLEEDISYGEAMILMGGRHDRRSNTERDLLLDRVKDRYLFGMDPIPLLPEWAIDKVNEWKAGGKSFQGNQFWTGYMHTLYRDGNNRLARDYDLRYKFEKYGYPL